MRRKKWSEEEEQTLISMYGEMSLAGTFLRLKTREKKFEPIAAHLNALHHCKDKASYPWEWSWRDLSVKIQNMRHQYLGVKQKIRRPAASKEQGDQDEYDWEEGIVHWSNFLKYKEIFGDVELDSNDPGTGGSSPASTHQNKPFDVKLGRGRCRVSALSMKTRYEGNGNSAFPDEGGVSTLANMEREDPIVGAGDDAGVSRLGLEWDEEEDDGGEEEEEGLNTKKSKRQRCPMKTGDDNSLLTEGKILAFLGTYITEQREREAQREVREREKEKEREEREMLREAAERERERSREEQERRREREREERDWEREVVNRDRWEEERQRERVWEEKRERDKQEWRERMTTLQLEHQASMAHMQAQLMQNQQTVLSLLLGMFLHGSPVEETPGQRSSLASQILRNLQQQQGGGGAVQAVEQKGGIDDNNTHYVVDGEVDMAAAD